MLIAIFDRTSSVMQNMIEGGILQQQILANSALAASFCKHCAGSDSFIAHKEYSSNEKYDFVYF